MLSIAENLETVRQRLAHAALRAGRSPEAIELLAVSKTCPAEAVRAAHAAGQRAFGENYVQEALDKIHALADLRTELVWHLIGPQACGKTRYAETCIAAVRKLGGVGARMESHEFQTLYGGNPERVAEDYPGLSVLMIEDNMTRAGDTPPHYMRGDRVIDLTNYLPIRRAGIEGIQTKIRLNQPEWPEDKVQAQAKHQYEAHIAGCSVEGTPC